MAYGEIKVDTITFTDGGIDKSVSISGLVQNPTFSGNITVTGTISGNTLQGQTVSGVTVTGATAAFTTGTFISLTGTTIQGTTATYTTGSFTSLTGTTISGTTAIYTTGTFTSLTGTTTTGTTANFVSGVFSTQISGATITGTTAAFTTVTGGVATITSGVFALGTASLPSISFSSDPNTGIYSPGTDQVAISTNGTGRLFVDASGNVGVGTTSPARLFEVQNTNPAIDGFARISSTHNGAFLEFAPAGASTLRQYTIGSAVGGSLIFYDNTASSQRAAIDSSGRLLVGTSSARANFYNSTVDSRILLESNSVASGERILANVHNSASANGPIFLLAKSRSASIGGNTLVVDGDALGTIDFQGNDGSEFVGGARIQVEVDGTPGANDMPGRLIFSTTADGASSPTERMRITSAGVLQIADAGNITVGTTTGTKIGTATTQKLGFWNATPVVQPAAVADATDAASVITQLNDLLAKLRTLGIIAT